MYCVGRVQVGQLRAISQSKSLEWFQRATMPGQHSTGWLGSCNRDHERDHCEYHDRMRCQRLLQTCPNRRRCVGLATDRFVYPTAPGPVQLVCPSAMGPVEV
jgi:hypothetical protein